MDVSGDKKAMARIRRACEVAKRTLSTQTSAQIEVESLHQGIDFSLSISILSMFTLNFNRPRRNESARSFA